MSEIKPERPYTVEMHDKNIRPMHLALCGLPLRPPRRDEVWLCYLCNPQTELLEIGQEIIDYKYKFMV